MATLSGVAGSAAVRTVLLTAKVAGVNDVAFKADPNAATPSLSHAKMTVTGTHTIMQFLAQQGKIAKQLVGATPEEEAQARFGTVAPMPMSAWEYESSRTRRNEERFCRFHRLPSGSQRAAWS